MSPKKINTKLINTLQREARHQAQLEKNKILPNQFNWLAWLIMRYPWLSLLILSLFSAIIIELI